MKRPAVFLDRDGTLVEEVIYLSRTEDLRVFPYTRRAIEMLKARGYAIVVVTNQSGISRGIYDETAMHSIHLAIQNHLDGLIDAFYFCPHKPEDGCDCRKPASGMFETAIRELDLDVERSWMIGDKIIDVEAGNDLGISTVLVLTGYGAEHQEKYEIHADYIALDLLAAAEHIVDLK
jgi:D-glycero-D-manno-heptose 1,7-bisphosphate phosphatase